MSELLFPQSSLECLRALREHGNGPRFNFESSDLLDRNSLADVRAYADGLSGERFWKKGELPEWMPRFLARMFSAVPYYREFGGTPKNFEVIPLMNREDLKSHAHELIPDDQNPEELTVYTTSGTSGTKLAIPTDAAVSSKVLVLIDSLLARHGTSLMRGPGALALVALFYQKETLQYPSLSHYLEGAATLKLNLHPDAWREESHRTKFLSELESPVITGSPHSLSVLAELLPGLKPQALMSSAVELHEGLQMELEGTFACPVYDVYSLTEAKFVAARGKGPGHALLCPSLYVEILDETGRVVPSGERGEIVLTGGRNRFLPLLRYRTGDFASLLFEGGQPYLSGLEGRKPVGLIDGDGSVLSTQDVVHALRAFPLVGFSFHQKGDRSFEMHYCGAVDERVLGETLVARLGLTGSFRKVPIWEGKPQRFTAPNSCL